jgi:hypothetical protein
MTNKNILQVYLNIHIIAYLLFLSYIAYKMYFFIDTKFNYLKTEIEKKKKKKRKKEKKTDITKIGKNIKK